MKEMKGNSELVVSLKDKRAENTVYDVSLYYNNKIIIVSKSS